MADHPVRKARKALGLTQAAASHRAGVSEKTLRNIENGTVPSGRIALRVADALSLDVAAVLGEPAEVAS